MCYSLRGRICRTQQQVHIKLRKGKGSSFVGGTSIKGEGWRGVWVTCQGVWKGIKEPYVDDAFREPRVKTHPDVTQRSYLHRNMFLTVGRDGALVITHVSMCATCKLHGEMTCSILTQGRLTCEEKTPGGGGYLETHGEEKVRLTSAGLHLFNNWGAGGWISQVQVVRGDVERLQ